MSAAADRHEAAWSWASAAVIAFSVASAYAGSLRATFQFDDWRVIVNEPAVVNVPAWWASMPGIRPLLKLSYALNNASGWGATGFHAVNLVLHAANSLMIFALLGRLTLREGIEPRRAQAISLMGALLWALHPVQTEAVTYISGRSVSLAAFFSLTSILAWMEGRARSMAWPRALSATLFGCALLVKETAAVVPLIILLWESGNGGAEEERGTKIPWAHLGVLAAGLGLAASSAMYRHLLSTSLHARSAWANLLTQAEGIGYLLGQLVRLDRLNADPALPVVTCLTGRVALQGLCIAGLLALGIVALRRSRPLAFGILWFLLFLAPTNSLLPRLDVANDRQLYLALAGPAWLAAWWLAALFPARRAVALAIAISLALVLGAATYRRNLVYADEITFWRDVTHKSPHNPRAFNNLGYAYALDGRKAEAETAFRRALALEPGDVRSAVNLRLLLEGGLTKRPNPP